MRNCANCGRRAVGKANADGFASCSNCGCANIIPRAQDYAAAAKVQGLLAKGWPIAQEERGDD